MPQTIRRERLVTKALGDNVPVYAAPTSWANIYLGLLEMPTKIQHTIAEVRYFLEDVCNHGEEMLCVSMTPTRYIYPDGGEEGVIIGLINFPVYPKTAEEFEALVLRLAYDLKLKFNQITLSVMFQDKTLTL